MGQLNPPQKPFGNVWFSTAKDAKQMEANCAQPSASDIYKLQTDEQALLEWNTRIAELREKSAT